MIFDAHTHIQFPAYDADRDEVIQRARAAGVKMIAAGTQAGTSRDAMMLAEQYPEDVWATVGFHPNHVLPAVARSGSGDAKEGGNQWYHDKSEQRVAVPEVFDIEKLRKLAAHPKVVAIGECGLDYYRLIANREAHIAKQKEIFRAQIALAKELKKPLVIHARPSKGTDDAYEDVLSLLSNVNGQMSKVFHFYAGSLSMTKKLVDAGSYFTFGGVTTFSSDYDESIRAIPMERLMLETDAPYVAPVPYRGKRNEPGVSYEEIVKQTTQNVLTVFKIAVS
ncbi:MAG: TatD family hydrolase [Candidatus Harrisonbacteria bacterium]|nr:TatD family hydrolase [Candidatus Harrisonbacteria bacterium]